MIVWPISFFTISGHSMEPFLRGGDKVVTWNWGKVKVGDVVVFKNGQEVWVKRVVEMKYRELGIVYRVGGDNKRDSLGVEPLKRAQIIGKVVFKW